MSYVSCLDVIDSPRWILTKNGLYPIKIITKSVILKLIINFILHISTYGIVIHNVFIALRTRNTTLLNWVTCVLLPMTNYYAKIATLIFRRTIFFSILDDLKSKEFNPRNKKLNENIQRVNTISKMLIRYFALSIGSCVIIFSFLPIVMNSLMMIPASFNTGRYDLLYKILHCIFTSYMSYTCFGVDILYMTLLGLCSAELDILHEKLLNTLNDSRNICNEYEAANIVIVEHIVLKECVFMHNKINRYEIMINAFKLKVFIFIFTLRFVEKLTDMLSFPMLTQYLSGCFMICYSILELAVWVSWIIIY